MRLLCRGLEGMLGVQYVYGLSWSSGKHCDSVAFE